MKTLLITLFCLFSFKRDCLQLDIIILADTSGSVDGYEKYVVEAVDEFTHRFELSESGVKIGLIEFNSSASFVFQLTSDTSLISNRLGQGLSATDGSTNLSQALILADNEFYSSRARSGYTKVLIIITDGSPDSRTLVEDQVNKMGGIIIAGVIIKSSAEDGQFLQSICSEGMYVETDYESLGKALSKMSVCL